MPKLSRLFIGLFLLLAVHYAASAQTVSFTMNAGFLRTMAQGDTIQPTFRVRINAHGPLHSLETDCEMHNAGTPLNVSLGTPSAIVVEPPNWCKFSPDGQLGQDFNALRTVWANLSDTSIVNRNCDVKGFLRIFTEHATGGGGASNPDHAYEFHPALSMRCGSQTFDFNNMMGAFPGLRHISPLTASNCITGRRLSVRFHQNRYEFSEAGGGTCGNFAIVRIEELNIDWSFALGGGHYAFADVTADGNAIGGLGIYTFSGTDMDTLLAQAIQQGGLSSPKVVHGVFTYDWQSIFDTLVDAQGNLRKPTQWQRIDFPLALIIYGETSTPF